MGSPPPSQPPTLRAVWTYEEWLAKDQEMKLQRRLWEANGMKQHDGDVVKDPETGDYYLFLVNDNGVGRWEPTISETVAIQPNPLAKIFDGPVYYRKDWSQPLQFSKKEIAIMTTFPTLGPLYLGGKVLYTLIDNRFEKVSPILAGFCNGLVDATLETIDFVKTFLNSLLKPRTFAITAQTDEASNLIIVLNDLWKRKEKIYQLFANYLKEEIENWKNLLQTSSASEREYLIGYFGGKIVFEIITEAIATHGAGLAKHAVDLLESATKALKGRHFGDGLKSFIKFLDEYELDPTTLNAGVKFRKKVPKTPDSKNLDTKLPHYFIPDKQVDNILSKYGLKRGELESKDWVTIIYNGKKYSVRQVEHRIVFLDQNPDFLVFTKPQNLFDVHHRIPQLFFNPKPGKRGNLLLNWDKDKLSNLQAIPSEIHRIVVDDAWRNFHKIKTNPTMEEIENFAKSIDSLLVDYINNPKALEQFSNLTQEARKIEANRLYLEAQKFISKL